MKIISMQYVSKQSADPFDRVHKSKVIESEFMLGRFCKRFVQDKCPVVVEGCTRDLYFKNISPSVNAIFPQGIPRLRALTGPQQELLYNHGAINIFFDLGMLNTIYKSLDNDVVRYITENKNLDTHIIKNLRYSNAILRIKALACQHIGRSKHIVVIVQTPGFERWLQRANLDYEMYDFTPSDTVDNWIEEESITPLSL